MDLLIRFLVGGAVVCVFALIGELFKPKSFAGLFGAAPSVAIATLALTISTKGAGYASIEARSMVLGAVALAVYAAVVSRRLMQGHASTRWVTLGSMAVWFAAAFGLWLAVIRPLQ